MRRRPTALLFVLPALVVLVVAGCGGHKTVRATPDKVVGTLPTSTQPAAGNLPALKLKGDPAAGKSVFASAGCGGCHVLEAAASAGTVGPDLDQAKPALERVVERVTLGKGVMPSFKGQLSSQQIADVAQFVAQAVGS